MSISSIDIIQTDINHCGGIASIHVDAAMPNFLVQEICSGVESGVKEKIWEEWFGFPAMRLVNGKYPLPTKPGLGFDLDEKQVARYRSAGTRPMARVFHPDGSVAAW
ncbi:MAG: enolase C-terminal domain-like protein [Acidobacteriota bacterium]